MDKLSSRSRSAIQRWPIFVLRVDTGVFFARHGFGTIIRDNFADGLEGFPNADE